jgi:hypothetical protein
MSCFCASYLDHLSLIYVFLRDRYQIDPGIRVMDIVIKSIFAVQPNRLLRDKLPRFGVEVAEAVVVEAGFSILVLARVAERTVLGLALALAHTPIAVERHFPCHGALSVVQGTQVAAHYTLRRASGRELSQRGKAVLLE